MSGRRNTIIAAAALLALPAGLGFAVMHSGSAASAFDILAGRSPGARPAGLTPDKHRRVSVAHRGHTGDVPIFSDVTYTYPGVPLTGEPDGPVLVPVEDGLFPAPVLASDVPAYGGGEAGFGGYPGYFPIGGIGVGGIGGGIGVGPGGSSGSSSGGSSGGVSGGSSGGISGGSSGGSSGSSSGGSGSSGSSGGSSGGITPPPVSAVPEPASWMMLILGFGVIGGLLRRRGRPFQVAA